MAPVKAVDKGKVRGKAVSVKDKTGDKVRVPVRKLASRKSNNLVMLRH
ncbi:hypothetical protein [Pelotomaculum propionicicum]|nr:hypothetical protein [Pelotomaculum propionicicum]NLI12755.1 hypothetical protein [Peptococcaceae bacterium]